VIGFARVEEVMRRGIGSEFTGAVARIEHRGHVVFERAYGTTRLDALARPVYCDTRFDLASLTKLFVATIALRLIDERLASLDAPLDDVVPQWSGTSHEGISLRMLLAHNSGMDSGADYRAILNENVERFAMRAPLLSKPGERVIYSDLGFIALGAALERIADSSLPGLMRRYFGDSPLFRPRASLRAAIPATEEDAWRGRVQGVVHDEKAYLMNGVAGHAGLFGSAADVAALTSLYLRPAFPLAADAVVEQAYDPVLRRGLGWALKTSDTNSCGRWFDRSSFGHTGFVGTCVWADPTRDLQGVLLTNNVYFGRETPAENAPSLRIAFYEAMVGDLNLR
jgi:CubicO group peptidase (beta-lactamase class C family)